MDFIRHSILSKLCLYTGDLKNVDITLNMTLLYLEENVFKAPLQSMVAGTVHLKGGTLFYYYYLIYIKAPIDLYN